MDKCLFKKNIIRPLPCVQTIFWYLKNKYSFKKSFCILSNCKIFTCNPTSEAGENISDVLPLCQPFTSGTALKWSGEERRKISQNRRDKIVQLQLNSSVKNRHLIFLTGWIYFLTLLFLEHSRAHFSCLPRLWLSTSIVYAINLLIIR